MLYRFKSRATADLLMLEPHGRRLLAIIGKAPDPSGIILLSQIAAALAAIDLAIFSAEANASPAPENTYPLGDSKAEADFVSLRQRALPLQDMLRRSAAAGNDVVWGV